MELPSNIALKKLKANVSVLDLLWAGYICITNLVNLALDSSSCRFLGNSHYFDVLGTSQLYNIYCQLLSSSDPQLQWPIGYQTIPRSV